MKRDDLFTTLNQRYNTFTYTIQDPEAFHHDVYEISRDADTAEQFHSLLAVRQKQRLGELNESLEALSVEIIANPKLIGSEQWQHALQLFRTRSYDSIVRFFASYLPDDYLDRQSTSPDSCLSEVDTASTVASSALDEPCSRPYDDDLFSSGPAMAVEARTHEHRASLEGPPSPPDSETTQSESAAPSPSHSHAYSTNPRSRSMSFSDSGSDLCPGLLHGQFERHDDDETWQSDSCDTAVTSVCDSLETRSACASADEHDCHCSTTQFPDDDDFSTAQFPEDDVAGVCAPPTWSTASEAGAESDIPTPRQESMAVSFMHHKMMTTARLSSPRRRSPFPRSHPSERGAGVPWLAGQVRRSPEEALSRVQKPVHEIGRKRPKGRRRAG